MSGLPDDVDRLISPVPSKPMMWDKTCEKYKNKFKTQEAWKGVGVDIFTDFDDTKKIELGEY